MKEDVSSIMGLHLQSVFAHMYILKIIRIYDIYMHTIYTFLYICLYVHI